jgi:CMP-N-acetylneuraminic acid synthetase
MNKPAITALITIQEKNTSYLADSHFKELGGKPLFRIMIDKLLAVKAIERILITTDSAVVRKTYGGNNKISLIDLPGSETLSEEYSTARILEEMPTSDRITAYSLAKINGEHFMQTQCINPILSVRTIEDAIERYYEYVLNQENEYPFDSVISLSRVEKRLFDNSNYPTITLRDEPHFVIFEDTILNIFSRTSFVRNHKQKLGKNPMFFEVPEIENLAVESPASYKLAKLVYDNLGLVL